jgi:hypothetical protein
MRQKVSATCTPGRSHATSWNTQQNANAASSPNSPLDAFCASEGAIADFSPEEIEMLKNANVGQLFIAKAVGSDWWEWLSGSTLIFWRYGRQDSNAPALAMVCLLGYKRLYQTIKEEPRNQRQMTQFCWSQSF